MNALVRGHLQVETEDEARAIRGTWLATHASAEELDRALDRRRADGSDDDGGDEGDDDGLAEALAVWGLRLEE